MNLLQNVDSYCERMDFALLSEPLNLISNIGFILAAFFIWRDARQLAPPVRGSVKTLYSLIFLIGIGSALFHSFANILTMILDVVPIGLYIVCYLWHWNTTLMGFDRKKSLFVMGAWLMATLLSSILFKEAPLAGSESYIAIGFFLPWMAFQQNAGLTADAIDQKPVKVAKDRSPKNHFLAFASGLFIISLVLRSIDPYVCPFWAYGTHFLWHIFNSILLYLTAANSILILGNKAE
jgi:hypothetical protein